MKFIALILIFLLAFIDAQAQQTELDSLKNNLLKAKNDTMRMHAFRALGSYYDDLNLDSAVHYFESSISLARILQLKLDEADLNVSLSFPVSKMGNYSRSFNLLNEAIAIVNNPANKVFTFGAKNLKKQDIETILFSWIHYSFSVLYRYSGNYRKAILSAIESRKFYETIKDSEGLSYTYGEIGNAYVKLDKPDSALYFNKIALEYGLASPFKKYLGYTFIQLGETYQLLGDLDLAQYNFKKAIEVSGKYNKPILVGDAQLKLAHLFQQQNKFDSSLLTSKKALAILKPAGKEKSTFLAYRMISDCYRSLGKYDSSYVYLIMASELNDKIQKSDKEKIQEFQAAGFIETLKAQDVERERIQAQNKIRSYGMISGLIVLSVIGLILYHNNKKERKAKYTLENTLTELKSTQSQLIQSEKMASLGELTAGIAHEIQNPLNFVNNFSEVSAELVSEMKIEIEKGNTQDAKEIAGDLKQNLEKINHHGKRAANIVKGMLQHSRTSTGQKELTDINALADEYLRLAYQGLRAKDNSFNAKFETHLDPTLPKLNVIPQDIGRVLLNLINNAFYAVSEKSKVESQKLGSGYEPTVSVSTKNLGDKIEVSVKDNGNGIPDSIKEKIFQPFFTTKPTGQGTGLGLSLSYDIVKAHGGAIKVNTKENEETEFIIQLPVAS